MVVAGTGTHVLMFPYPAQGHMIALLDLTHQLATKGLTITFLVTPKNLHILKPLLSTNPSITTLVLPFPAHPLIPDGVENAQDMPAHLTPAVITALGGLHQPLLSWFRSHASPPVAIISDIFLGWTHHLASELGIRRIAFSPAGGLSLAVMHALWCELPKRNNPNDENEVVSFPNIPNTPKFPWKYLSPLYSTYVEGDPVSEFLKNVILANIASWGLIMNSFTEFDRVYLQHLRDELGHDRVWAVGPLQPKDHDQSGTAQRGGSSSVPANLILSWLDKREDHKVVYVTFGSQTVLTNDQMEQLASGLEKSGVHFVWSVKEPIEGQADGEYATVPPGFEDRVAGRGLVIRGWAPQVSILRHRAVGAILCHCGWNTVLEAIVAGVVMLAWPMGADQFRNAIVLEQQKAGVKVCEGAETVPDSAYLAQVIAESVDENRVERQRVMELREAAGEATSARGSSAKDLESFVAHLAGLEFSFN
ncbi:hypothetical protein FNV43_RR20760 [Rhamnella rubrinervis]|uniref:Glycosyltransferase N-terminal domain-containing protein n=1 Tax=Rhamnella rubrinervis TaxID=2594499 RepID=A0A8K0E1S2_9ROSA|nr:hypothetical protein FNV43_RR20760 [Rhamnella rubrinervis]